METKNNYPISIAQISVVTLLIGVLQQIVYYNTFNLPIKYFLGISEIGLLISEDLFFTAPIAILITSFINYVIEENEIEKDKRSKFNYLSIKRLYKGLFLLFILLSCYAYDIWVGYDFSAVNWVFYLSCTLLTITILFYFGIKNYLKSSAILYFVMTILVLNITLFLRTGKEIRKTKDGKFYGTIIETKEDKNMSNLSSYFIGKTDRYICIYDSKHQATKIIKTDDVTFFQLRSH